MIFNKQQKYIAFIIMALLGLSVANCSDAIESSPARMVLPDGTTALTNGMRISDALTNIHVRTGQQTSDVIKIDNLTAQQDLGLQVQTTGGLKVQLCRLSKLASSTSTVIHIRIDASHAQEGQQTVQLLATRLPGSPVVSTIMVNVSDNYFVKSSYLQLEAVGSLPSITSSGVYATNMMIFAFANINSSSVDPVNVSTMQTILNEEAEGTINLLSVGGQTATADSINVNTVSSVVDHVIAQIDAYNQQLSGGKISGVDLDLENNIDADTINTLAYAFRANGLLVSVAPQVYLTSGNNVDPSNPINLSLSSGGANNQYGKAIAEGSVDYIQAQTYNTGGWTVGGSAENQVSFFQSIAQALHNSVYSSCTNVSNLCIPQGTAILIGEPANAGASGTNNNIYGSNGSTSYDQATILTTLVNEWSIVQGKYVYISGVMQWSLNNDYDPSGWGDSNATAGAFSSALFGAAPTPPPSQPYFILQVSNTGPDVAGEDAYASATIVVDGQYWVFGTSWNSPIAPTYSQLWGTLTSSLNPTTPGVTDSASLDTLFSDKTSFTASSILINGYSSQSQSLSNYNHQYTCPSGEGFVFQAGHSYNLMVNAASHTCAITLVV